MKRYCIAILLIPFISLTPIDLWADKIKFENFASDDNADVNQRKHILGYIKSVPSSFDKVEIGVHGGHWVFDEANSEKQFTILGLSGEIDFGAMGMLSSELMSYNSNAWSTETFNLYYRQPNLKPFYLEANVERSIVDSLLAINNEVMVDTYSFSLDFPVSNQLTLVGAGIYQNFTDNNAKHGGLIKLVYTPEKIEGLNTALVFKQMKSDQPGTGYFSPDKQQQIYLDTSYATAIVGEKFLLKTSLALGKEIINDSIRNDLLKAEINLRGWFNDVSGLEARLGCSNTGDVLTNRDTSNYRYCYANLNYIHQLD